MAMRLEVWMYDVHLDPPGIQIVAVHWSYPTDAKVVNLYLAGKTSTGTPCAHYRMGSTLGRMLRYIMIVTFNKGL